MATETEERNTISVQEVIDRLTRPEAYPHPVGTVVVVQTHISVVFLAGEYAYKLKKPVDLGFVDYGTRDKRLHFCREEIRLNRRLAPSVYLGVAPVIARGGGEDLTVGEPLRDPGEDVDPEAVDYVVKMKRLPDERHFGAILKRGDLNAGLLHRLAEKLTDFYRNAESGERISRLGGWNTVEENTEENFVQIEPFVGNTLSERVFRQLRQLNQEHLKKLSALIERRALEGVPRDTHGDLRLEHIFYFPDAAPGERLLVVDCVEFNERLRYADPVADVAFLVMELENEEEARMGEVFSGAYFSLSGDPEGRILLPFYVAYRHVVRGKVSSIKASQGEASPEKRGDTRARAARHFLRAYGKLASPGERSCLVLTAGLPGVGKSTLSRRLQADLGFSRYDSDVIRKQLAGIPEETDARADYGEGLYTAAWTERTYEELLRLAQDDLFQGLRVVVDACFPQEAQRLRFLDAARTAGVPSLLLLCEAPPEAVKNRLSPGREGVSDAGWKIHCEASGNWETLGEETRGRTFRISTDERPEEAFSRAVRVLEQEGLLETERPVARSKGPRDLAGT